MQGIRVLSYLSFPLCVTGYTSSQAWLNQKPLRSTFPTSPFARYLCRLSYSPPASTISVSVCPSLTASGSPSWELLHLSCMCFYQNSSPKGETTVPSTGLGEELSHHLEPETSGIPSGTKLLQHKG